MSNMPHVTPLEIAIVSTAVLVLYLIPALLALVDARRRRRVERAALAAAQQQSTVSPQWEDAASSYATMVASLGTAPDVEPQWPHAPEPSTAERAEPTDALGTSEARPTGLHDEAIPV